MTDARAQSDQIATAVDNPLHYKINSPTMLALLAKPLSSTFYKNCIASGSIVPPRDEADFIRATDFKVGLCVICLGLMGITGMLTAYFWKG